MAFFAFNPNNRRSHPFWDFVASVDDLNQRPPSYAPRDREEAQAAGRDQNEEKAQYKGPSVEDEKMANADAHGSSKIHVADPEKTKNEKGKGHDEKSGSSSSSDEEPCGCRRCHRAARKAMRHGPPGPPPPFGPFGFPGFFGPGADGDFTDWAPPHRRHGHHHGSHARRHCSPPPPPGPGFAPGPHGPPGPPHQGENPPPHPPPEFGPRGHHGRRHGRGGPFGRRGPGRDFNLPAFLAQLGNRLGVDLNAAAANFGVDLSRAAGVGNSDADFVPQHDTFDLADEYLVHVSLPGAHREDIGLDFDGENHTLRVGGVVYRPGVDETISSAITHSGRDREIGVFETRIRLPSKDNDLIGVNPANISAKLREGVLVVHVPKIHKKKEDLKRSIRIESPSPSPEPDVRGTTNLAVREKDINRNNPFAAENKEKEKGLTPRSEGGDMYYSSPAFPKDNSTPRTEQGDHYDGYNDHTSNKEKEAGRDVSMKDHVDDPPEQLPTYTPSHQDHDHDDGEDDQEGEYVKINVN